MSSNKLIVLVPAIVILLLAGSCAPTTAPESIPSPPPTNEAHALEIGGYMTLNLDTPNALHGQGAASCEAGHSLVREWDQNAAWDVDWSGRVVIIGVQLSILADPPTGPTWVDRMLITFREKTGEGVTYSSNGSLSQDATRTVDGGQFGEVNFQLRQSGLPPSAPALGSQWPASIEGRISWRCDR